MPLVRNVNVTASRRRDAQNLNEEIAITWVPVGDGPFPTFSCRLIVWSEERRDEAFIQLEGSYEPPLGEAGQVFDAAIGSALAQRTAAGFLRDIRDGVLVMQSHDVRAQPQR